jgi:hypothetical protein
MLAARIMVVYSFLVDASAYGSYAASGGNLAASIAAGLCLAGGVAGVEAAAAAAMRARLKAAGRSLSFLGP